MTVYDYLSINNIVQNGKHRYRIFFGNYPTQSIYIYANNAQELEAKWMNYCIESGMYSDAFIKMITFEN